jgi:poly(hydroxyalkanoate) depolymerase family esterase
MRWSRELRIARRSLRTAVKAVAAMAGSRTNLPAGLRSRALTPPANPRTSPGLTEVTDFGSNPGRLSMLVYVPNVAPAPNAALIVLLHGCGQAAASFSRDTGWIALADRLGIPLVLPEQADANNRGRCFNWFRPLHTGRGLGEALSVRQMVAVATQRFQCDPSRVFIAGLSAGGAMTAALLAAYPDVFAAGAVVAGLPVGAANGTVEALARMAEAGPRRTREAWAQQVRNAAPVGFVGPWPRISIWHGSADDVVDPGNARLLAEQWSCVHGLPDGAGGDQPAGARREIWGEPGRPSVELWTLPALAHRWPDEAVGYIGRFWGLDRD